MATLGLKTFLYAPMATETPTYSKAPAKLAGAIEAKVDIEQNDAKLYADDELQDSDESFISGKITLGVDDDDPDIFGPILGKTVDAESGEVSSNSDDKPMFVGFGYITRNSGEKKYRAKFYPKVKFKDFDTEAKTKQDKLEYVTPSVEGTVYALEDGNWKTENRFATKAEAVAYLEGCFTQVTP